MPRDRDIRVPLREALRVLLASEASHSHPAHLQGELAASISHWLQSPATSPILVGAVAAHRWKRILRSYATLSPSTVGFNDSLKGSRKVLVDFRDIPFAPPPKPTLTFIDLFAGIGGFRLALQKHNAKCVFSSEWDRRSKETYFANYGEVPFGDIRQFTGDQLRDEDIDALIPNHDILAGGFPCQPFSRAGVSARNSLGRSHGFSCEIQGTLFFDMMRIAKVKRPRVLFLENVKNLRSHDEGRTFERIRTTIQDDLGYSFHDAVIDASPLVPQRRQRCYMVCFRDGRAFEFPKIVGPSPSLRSVLEDDVVERYTLSDRMWRGHRSRTKRNLARGVGFTAFEANLDGPANTLVARYYKDGKECLIPQEGRNPRLLTPRECARLQGYPEQFLVHAVDGQAYRQFGNSVAVPVVDRIVGAIVSSLKSRR